MRWQSTLLGCHAFTPPLPLVSCLFTPQKCANKPPQKSTASFRAKRWIRAKAAKTYSAPTAQRLRLVNRQTRARRRPGAVRRPGHTHTHPELGSSGRTSSLQSGIARFTTCHVQRIATRVMQMIKASRKSSLVLYPPLLRLLHVSVSKYRRWGLLR